MKRVCTRCNRISPDGNLWCQEPECPAGASSVVFSYGDMLGDIEISRLISVMQAAALYEARRGEEQLLLKVAHDDSQEQLKREAFILASVNGQHPMLPILVSPYPHADVKQRPYGKTVFRDETKYYEVFEFVDGELLRDYLAKNPQPFYQHAAWLTISIADAIAFLHVKAKKLHLNISPDVVFVRFDRDSIPRPLLFDLGAATNIGQADAEWTRNFAAPAYLPPELVDARAPVSAVSDVYGLGLLLYEMLAGQPAYEARLRRDEDVRQSVVRHEMPRLNRTDLSDEILGVVYQATDAAPARRQQDVRTFAKALRSKFGEVPPERRGSGIPRKVLIGVTAAVLVIVVLILLSAAFG